VFLSVTSDSGGSMYSVFIQYYRRINDDALLVFDRSGVLKLLKTTHKKGNLKEGRNLFLKMAL